MGVPAFFRWLSKKFPSIVVHVDDQQDHGYHFDNLYLDMNGIIHPCTHPEHKKPPETEEEMFDAIFEYIENIMRIVKPKKLLYMAVDGVAPRAKMNQQRSRRFRASKESAEKKIEVEKIKDELRQKGVILEEREDKKHFDSNVITPGTDFMMNLSKALRGWIDIKLNRDLSADEDGIWPKELVVILSDASVPGEGEHKIMDYIRKQRAHENYNPNLSHCLCGADADLIMLSLATHELNFTILREEFLPNQPRPCEICGQIGHEMAECEGTAREEDGNGIIPTEPGFIFIRINVLREYLAKDAAMGRYDVERYIDDFVFMCFFVGNDFLPHLPSLEIREGAIDRLMDIYRDVMKRHEGQYLTNNGFVNLSLVQQIMFQLGQVEDEVFKKRQRDQKWFRERQKRQKQQKNQYKPVQHLPWMKPEAILPRGEKPDPFSNAREEALKMRQFMKESNLGAAAQLKAMLRRPGEDVATTSAPAKRKFDQVESDSEPEDGVNLGTEGWKERYYYLKFDATDPKHISHIIAAEYVLGLCWVLRYYYQGCPDWKWFYPFHYAPFASDFVDIDKLKINFDADAKPFKPLEQLMSVFPAASASCLPESWRKLMMDNKSPIIDFYPTNFKIDLNGKHAAWMGVALLPFIDEERMFSTLTTVYPNLTKRESERNSLGPHLLFYSRENTKALEFVEELKDKQSEEKTDIDGDAFDGLAGQIRINKYSDLYKGSICVEYYDPDYPKDYTFQAVVLKGAVPPPKVLKPEDFKGGWKPMIGMQRNDRVANLDGAGRRMLNNSLNQGPSNNYSNAPLPAFKYNAFHKRQRFT